MQIKASSAYDMLPDPCAAGPSTSHAANTDAFVDPAHIHSRRVQEADAINQMLQQALSWHANSQLCAGAQSLLSLLWLVLFC